MYVCKNTIVYLIKTPKALKYIYPSCYWTIPDSSKTVYLTFDDGPTPGITDKVLNILEQHQAKATFFCVGEQAEKHFELFESLRQKGHHVGNHTFNHLKGWTTSISEYLDNIKKADKIISSTLFRPPYGKASRTQIAQIKKKYHLIMWDILAGDFDANNTIEKIVSNVISNIQPGSIVVLHDSKKHGKKMLKALPVIMKKLDELGYSFKAIPCNLNKKIQD